MHGLPRQFAELQDPIGNKPLHYGNISVCTKYSIIQLILIVFLH